MCPYAVSATGTATTFVTATIAAIKLGKISQGSYPTNLYDHVIQKTAEAVTHLIYHLLPPRSN